MSSSQALASLTATYTDSEGEDEDVEKHMEIKDPPSTNISPHDVKSDENSRTNSPIQVKITSKFAQLVSYHDDTIASDDEGNDEPSENHKLIILNENESLEPPEPEPIDDEGIQLPPEAPGHCSSELQEKILRLYEKMQSSDLDMNAVIQQRKDFRNPSIYEKLIQFCGINELGTNYPPSIYDPLKWSKESYYEELAKVQKADMEKRDKDKKSKVEVVSGTKRQEDDAKKRKSKWDQPGGNVSSTAIKPAGLVQPSLTTNSTGTKATVIPAFGSLPKKPR